MSYLLKGIFIGLFFGVPVGAVGVMTVQRTFDHGFHAGFITGLGSSVADCLYACISGFGLTFLFAFSYFGITGENGRFQGIQLAAGVSSQQESDVISETTEEKEEGNMYDMEIMVGNRTFSTVLYDNETVRAFIKLLPMTLNMSELNGNEKYYYLSDSLPAEQVRPSGIHAGDLMLFGDSCLVLFYESFSTGYSYTALGRVENPAGLAAALGADDVQVTFRMK